MTDINGSELNVMLDKPPVHMTSDYVEMAFLAVLISVGVPLNTYVLWKMHSQLRIPVSFLLFIQCN